MTILIDFLYTRGGFENNPHASKVKKSHRRRYRKTSIVPRPFVDYLISEGVLEDKEVPPRAKRTLNSILSILEIKAAKNQTIQLVVRDLAKECTEEPLSKAIRAQVAHLNPCRARNSDKMARKRWIEKIFTSAC